TIPCHHRGCRARRLRSRDCKHRSHSRRAREAGARAKQEDPGASPAEDRAGHGAGAAVAAIARGFGEIAVRPARRTTMRQACGMLRSEEHTSELQSRVDLVCRLLLEKKNR